MNLRLQINRILKSHNFKHGMLYMIFSFLNSGISFILVLILAKFLTPYDYGKLNLFTTFVTLVNIVITLCTTSYITVSFFKKDYKSLRQIITIAFGVTTLMLIVISIFLGIFPSFIEKSIGISRRFLGLGLLICYFQVFNAVNLDIWRLEEKPVTYGIYSVSFAICNFILTFWLIVGFNFGWQGRVYAWWLLGFIYFIISLIFLVRRRYLVVTLPSKALINETLIYSLPLLPHTLSFWLKQGLDRYIINYFYDQSIVGYFSFAANLAAIIGIVGNAFNATNSVFIYKKLANGYKTAKNSLEKQTLIMSYGFFLVSVLVGLFAWCLVNWGMPKYEKSTVYIIPLCLGGFFQCIYLLWVNYLFFYKQTKQLMHVTLSTALLQVVLSIVFTRYSSIMTAYISMFISGLTALIVYKLSKKQIIINS